MARRRRHFWRPSHPERRTAREQAEATRWLAYCRAQLDAARPGDEHVPPPAGQQRIPLRDRPSA